MKKLPKYVIAATRGTSSLCPNIAREEAKLRNGGKCSVILRRLKVRLKMSILLNTRMIGRLGVLGPLGNTAPGMLGTAGDFLKPATVTSSSKFWRIDLRSARAA